MPEEDNNFMCFSLDGNKKGCEANPICRYDDENGKCGRRPPTEDTEPTQNAKEDFTMMNDGSQMNNILVFGVLIVLFLFVYIYGFHGLLKFEKNINYLLTIMFSGIVILTSLVFIMNLIGYVSDGTMSEEEKVNARNGLMVTIAVVVLCSMLAFIRYNYALLYNSLNKTLK